MASTHLGSHQTEAEAGRVRPCARPPPFASVPGQLLSRARHGESRLVRGGRGLHGNRRRRSGRGHPQALSQAAHPVPQPLAPFRGRRRRPQGRARPAAGRPAADTARPRDDRPDGGQRAARCRRGPRLEIRRARHRPDASPAPRAWPWRASTPSPPACFPATGTSPARRIPPACAAWSPITWPRRSRSASTTRWSALKSRAVLLRRLGEVMSEQPEVFGEDGRPGGLFDMIISPLGPDVPPHGGRDGPRHPVAAPDQPVGHLARDQQHRDRCARRLLAPFSRARRRPDRRLDALPQAVAVADLFAAGAVRVEPASRCAASKP